MCYWPFPPNQTLYSQCILCPLCWRTRRSCSASSQASTGVHTEGKESLTHQALLLTPTHRNPLGCAVATTALDILIDERLSERAEDLGEKFRLGIRALNSPLVKEVRGRGLLNAVVIDESKSKRGRTAWQLCLILKSMGVLSKPTHVNMCGLMYTLQQDPADALYPSRIRFAPPLVIEETDLLESIKIIGKALDELDLVSTRFRQPRGTLCLRFRRWMLSPVRSRVRRDTRSMVPTDHLYITASCFLDRDLVCITR